jgi:hypothetical protein
LFVNELHGGSSFGNVIVEWHTDVGRKWAFSSRVCMATSVKVGVIRCI